MSSSKVKAPATTKSAPAKSGSDSTATPAAAAAPASKAASAKAATPSTAKPTAAAAADAKKPVASAADAKKAAAAASAALVAKKLAAAKAAHASEDESAANGVHAAENGDAGADSKDAESAEAKATKSRQQLTAILKIDISQARCTTHLKKNLGDETLGAEIKELRKEKKALEDQILTPKQIETRIAALRKRLENAKARKAAAKTKKTSKAESKDDDDVETSIESQIEDMRAKLEQISGQDAELEAATRTEIEAKIAVIKKQIDKKSKGVVRLSGEAPVASAVVIDFMIKEVLAHGLNQAKAADAKLLEVDHIHTGSTTELVTWPLIRTLPSYKEYTPEHEEEILKQKTEENKRLKEAREAKKAAEAAAKKQAAGKKAAAAAAVKKAEADADGEEDEEHKTTFFTYVDNAIKTVKKDEGYKNIRISNRVREYCSDLVSEFLVKVADLARIIVQQVMGVRTLNADHIKAIVTILLSNEGRTDEEIDPIVELVDEKLQIYNDHQKAEKARKIAEMDEDKKRELDEKKRRLEVERKKKAIETAHRNAQKAEEKARKLAEDIAQSGAPSDSHADADADSHADADSQGDHPAPNGVHDDAQEPASSSAN